MAALGAYRKALRRHMNKIRVRHVLSGKEVPLWTFRIPLTGKKKYSVLRKVNGRKKLKFIEIMHNRYREEEEQFQQDWKPITTLEKDKRPGYTQRGEEAMNMNTPKLLSQRMEAIAAALEAIADTDTMMDTDTGAITESRRPMIKQKFRRQTPYLKALKRKLSRRMVRNPLTKNKVKLWSFRIPLTKRVMRRIKRKQGGIKRVMFHEKMHQLFKEEEKVFRQKWNKKKGDKQQQPAVQQPA